MPRRAVVALCLALCLAAAAVSALLVSIHLSEDAGPLAGLCRHDGCGEVLASRWAVFPPASPGERPVDARGVPVAAIGLFYFVALAAWMAVVGLPGARRRGWHAALLQVVGLGCTASLAWIGLMFFVIDAACPLCLSVHGCHLAVFGLLLAGRSARRAAPDPEHPRPRLAGATLALGLAAGGAAWLGLVVHAEQAENAHWERELSALERDAGRLEIRYFSDTRFTTDDEARARFDRILRPDDPSLPAASGSAMTLVYFSDPQCPSCHEFERLLSDVILPAFAGHLRVVYKHYPLVDTFEHSDAAARALEAARLQDRFWELKEVLLHRRDELDGLDWHAVAAGMGLDADRFVRDMVSAEAVARIAQDRRWAAELGVDATPAVFLNRRQVAPLAVGLAGFWRLRAEALRRVRESQGEGW